tara:strand:- start:266 stop:706 length:441 start_codon:yes stop_codon:yes gene_type:complete
MHRVLIISFIFNLIYTQCQNNDIPCISINSINKQFDELEIDSSGYYHFNYPDNIEKNPKDYGTIFYNTSTPLTRIGWFTPDSMSYEMHGRTFFEPIIQFSTYSGNNREGRQLFYINSDLIGDTLSIYAYYYSNKNIIDSVKVIIDK